MNIATGHNMHGGGEAFRADFKNRRNIFGQNCPYFECHSLAVSLVL